MTVHKGREVKGPAKHSSSSDVMFVSVATLVETYTIIMVKTSDSINIGKSVQLYCWDICF